MGRLLVWWFLSTVAFGIATLAAGFVYLVVLVGHAAGLPWEAATLVLWGPGVQNVWFTAAIVYFAWALPLGIVLAILPLWSTKRDSEPTPLRPPFPWETARVVAVLTAYNDEEAVGPSADEFRRIRGVDKVIVVDNNCTDRTAEVARAHGAEVISETQQGYGYACIRGLREALGSTQSEVVLLTEGDMTFYGDDAPKLLPYLEECDLVLGTRTNRTLTQPGSQMDWFLAWGNLGLAFLIRLRYWDRVFWGRVQLTDVGCTFRVIRRDALSGIIDQLTVGGYYFSPHMILVAIRNHLRVVEVPIKFRARVGPSKGAGRSRRRALRIGLSMVGEIGFH